jgi:hypothetical protein
MQTIPRSLALPVVCCVWVISLLVAGYTCTMLPWFRDYYGFYLEKGADAFRGSAFAPAGIATLFLRGHLIGVPLCLVILGYGARLLKSAAVGAAHVAWYATASVSLSAIWFVWVLAIQRSFYELLFPV